jgi:hypothetical protein
MPYETHKQYSCPPHTKLFAHSKRNDLRQRRNLVVAFTKECVETLVSLLHRGFLFDCPDHFQTCSSLLIPSRDTFHWFDVNIGSFSGAGRHVDVLLGKRSSSTQRTIEGVTTSILVASPGTGLRLNVLR